MTNRDEVARRVAERLGIRLSSDGTIYHSMPNKLAAASKVWDALISSVEQAEKAEARVEELQKALRAIMDEADQSNGGKGARLPILLYMRELAEAALSAKEKV